MNKQTSDAQINANRRNGALSHGPVSPEGKAKTRMNALTHGFAGHTVVIPDHEMDSYARHFGSFKSEYKPVGPTEEFLCQSLADLTYSASQIRSVMTNRINTAGCRPIPNSNETHSPKTHHAMAQAFSAVELAPALGTLGTYEARKMRLFHTTRRELIQIQTERKAREKQELEEAAKLREADLKTRQPHENEWQPTENGFVCSITQIDQFIAARTRRDSLLNRVA